MLNQEKEYKYVMNMINFKVRLWVKPETEGNQMRNLICKYTDFLQPGKFKPYVK